VFIVLKEVTLSTLPSPRVPSHNTSLTPGTDDFAAAAMAAAVLRANALGTPGEVVPGLETLLRATRRESGQPGLAFHLSGGTAEVQLALLLSTCLSACERGEQCVFLDVQSTRPGFGAGLTAAHIEAAGLTPYMAPPATTSPETLRSTSEISCTPVSSASAPKAGRFQILRPARVYWHCSVSSVLGNLLRRLNVPGLIVINAYPETFGPDFGRSGTSNQIMKMAWRDGFNGIFSASQEAQKVGTNLIWAHSTREDAPEGAPEEAFSLDTLERALRSRQRPTFVEETARIGKRWLKEQATRRRFAVSETFYHNLDFGLEVESPAFGAMPVDLHEVSLRWVGKGTRTCEDVPSRWLHLAPQREVS
jgi:hypothetical protein